MNRFLTTLIMMMGLGSSILLNTHASADDNTCSKIVADVKSLDAKISKVGYQCDNDPGRFKNYCDLTLNELKEKYRRLMNKTVLLDGVLAVKAKIEGDARRIEEIDKFKLDELEEKLKSFDESLSRGRLVQDTFRLSTKDDYIFRNFSSEADPSLSQTFDATKMDEFIEKQCSTTIEYDFCQSYKIIKDKYRANTSVWSDILKQIHGLANAQGKFHNQEEGAKQYFPILRDILSFETKDGSDPINPKEITNQAKLGRFYTALENAKSSDKNKKLKAMNELSELSNIFKNDINSDLKTIVNNDTEWIKDVKSARNAISKDHNDLLNQLNIFDNQNLQYDPKLLDEKIDSIKEEISKNAKLIEFRKKDIIKKQINENISNLASGCSENDLPGCVAKLKPIAENTSCNGDATCLRNKEFAKRYIKTLEDLINDEDLALLNHSQVCFEKAKSHQDSVKLQECIEEKIPKGNLSTLANNQYELETLEIMIKELEAQKNINDLYVAKDFALYLMRQNNCDRNYETFINSKICADSKISNIVDVDYLLDDLGNVVTAFKRAKTNEEIYSSVDEFKKFCRDKDNKEDLKILCDKEKLKVEKPKTAYVPSKYDSEVFKQEQYTPDVDAWVKEQTPPSGSNLGSFFGGVVSGVPEYMHYKTYGNNMERTFPYLRQQYQDKINYEANKEAIWEDRYLGYLNQYYYSNFFGGQWNASTDPFSPYFNFDTQASLYPPTGFANPDGTYQVNMISPQPNYTSGDSFIDNSTNGVSGDQPLNMSFNFQ